jgi:hypothetical protein
MYIKLEKNLIGTGLSHAAVICYALIADRMQLSTINGWKDNKGYYIYYSVPKISQDLGLQERRVYDILTELKRANLIHTAHEKGKPNKIYVLPVPDHFNADQATEETLDIEQLILNAARMEGMDIDYQKTMKVYDRIRDRIGNIKNKIGYIRRVLRNWNPESGAGSSGSSGASYDIELYDTTNTIIEWNETQ